MDPTQAAQSKRPSSGYDNALKRLLETAHDGFLALIAPDVAFVAALPTELPAATRLADLVWSVTFDDRGETAGADEREVGNGATIRRQGLLHIELQTWAGADLAERLVEYAVQLWVRERRARRTLGEREPVVYVRSIAVILRPSATIAQPPLHMLWGSERRLEFIYDVVKLWEIPPDRVLETENYQLWPLTSLMADVTPASAIAVAQRLADAPLPRAERSDLIGMLIALAGVRLGKADLSVALRRNLMIEDLLKESNFAEVIYDLALERGREEGREEGEAQGEAKGLRTSLRLVIEGRFGTLPDDLTQSLDALEPDALAELLRHAVTDTLEQIRARLGLG